MEAEADHQIGTEWSILPEEPFNNTDGSFTLHHFDPIKEWFQLSVLISIWEAFLRSVVGHDDYRELVSFLDWGHPRRDRVTGSPERIGFRSVIIFWERNSSSIMISYCPSPYKSHHLSSLGQL